MLSYGLTIESAKQAGFEKMEGLSEAEQAKVLGKYVVSGTTYATSKGAEGISKAVEAINTQLSKGAEYVQDKVPSPVSEVVVFGMGAVGGVLEAVGYSTMLPLMSSMLVDKVPSGSATAFAVGVAKGMAEFYTKT